MMKLKYGHLIGYAIIIIFGCGQHYVNPYREQIQHVSDDDIAQYIGSICLELGGHIGLTAIGHCGQCGGMTPCCNMQICDACAAAQGVCPFCLKKTNWTKNTDPDREIPLLLAILQRSDNIRARQVVIHALTQIHDPLTLEVMMQHSDEIMLSLELAVAVGTFKNARYIGFLKKVLGATRDDYFGDDEDIELQYYLSNAAQAAAQGLANIGTDKAIKILLHSAMRGKLWERCYAIKALGHINEPRVRTILTQCLKEFFDKDSDWKWIPGRDLIGATLTSLASIGNKETALLVIQYTRNPGCDFLYDDLKKCLVSIGAPAVPELIAAIEEDLNNGLYDWGRLVLVEALGDIGTSEAVPFLVKLLDRQYPDEWSARDFKEVALRGLGHLKAHDALEKIDRELFNGTEESTRQAAAQALGIIGGSRSFAILEKKLEGSDAQWVERECLASLITIAFKEMNTAEMQLKASQITAKKGGAESAFQLMYQPIMDAEPWAIDLFFENLADVPLQRNFYRVVELLNTDNKIIFARTYQFLKSLTKIKDKISFDDSDQKKYDFKQTLWNWYQEYYSNH